MSAAKLYSETVKRTDNRMREAIEAGQRNAEAIELMRNWCAHARARRMGGVGMVEQMTGLPISHFSMECDYAPAGGAACWDFGESALDFYDRNCSFCAKRQPVGFPNLSRLVSERDKARRFADARERVERDRVERALKARADARRALRPLLDPVNQAVLDDLDAYDRDRDEVDRKRLVEAARLAPERLDPRLIDLLFDQAGATTSLDLVALEVGAGAARGERRLLLLAQRLFRSGVGGDCATDVLLTSLSRLSDEDVTDLVPAAAELARPDHRSFLGDGVELHSDPRLLLEMWRLRPDAVRRGIDHLLDRRNAPDSQLAGRMMALVMDIDRAAAAGFVRTAASRYVRARQLSVVFWRSMGGWTTYSSTLSFRWDGKRFALIGFDRETLRRNTGETETLSINFVTARARVLKSSMQDDVADSTRWQRLPTQKPESLETIGDALAYEPKLKSTD